VYGGGVGLHEVDLAVPAGGVYGLVGPNGAGKTTLLTLLAGLRRASAGTMHATGRVMLCPDTPAFEPWLTAVETVRLFAAAGADIDRALSLAGLADVRERRVGGFSRGMTQRLGLAVTLASGADVLLLDEPTSALDPQGRSDMLDLVKELGRDHAVVMSSHILADVQRVADTVGVLRDGHLIYQGGVAELIDRHTRPSWRLHLRSGADALAARLAGLTWVAGVKPIEGGLQVDTLTLAAGETLLPAQIAESGAELVAFNPVGADLETVFLTMVGAAA
jgi:ABC-2 type transport system ATP-binding protein